MINLIFGSLSCHSFEAYIFLKSQWMHKNSRLEEHVKMKWKLFSVKKFRATKKTLWDRTTSVTSLANFWKCKKCQNSKNENENLQKWIENFSRQKKMCGQQKNDENQVFRSKTWMWLIFEKEEHFKHKILN